MPAPGGHHREAAAARPVDQVADQRGLVAEGERVDDTRLRSTFGQQRATERIGFDRHVDDMLAVREGLKAMVDGSDRMSRAFDDDVDRGMAHQGLPVVADMRAAIGQRSIEARCLHALGRPADAREVAARGLGVEVGDAGQVHPGRARHLREVHAAEFAGADQADAHRPCLSGALLELGEQRRHGVPFPASGAGLPVAKPLDAM